MDVRSGSAKGSCSCRRPTRNRRKQHRGAYDEFRLTTLKACLAVAVQALGTPNIREFTTDVRLSNETDCKGAPSGCGVPLLRPHTFHPWALFTILPTQPVASGCCHFFTCQTVVENGLIGDGSARRSYSLAGTRSKYLPHRTNGFVSFAETYSCVIAH